MAVAAGLRVFGLGRRLLPAMSRSSPSLLRRRDMLLRGLCVASQQQNKNSTEQQSSGDAPSGRVEETAAGDKAAQEIAALEEKTKLEEQVKDLTDRYKRALADTENVRRRSQRMIEDGKIFGIQSFCKDLLEVADILQKATESVPKEELNDANPHLKSLYEGLILTESQLQKVFTKHGLVPLNPIDAKFDPYEHEALFQVPMEGKDPGTVGVVTKIGYKLHNRIVRPAIVGVVKGP